MQIRKNHENGQRGYYSVFDDKGNEIAYFSYLPATRFDGSVFNLYRMADHKKLASTSDVTTERSLGPGLAECKRFVERFFDLTP